MGMSAGPRWYRSFLCCSLQVHFCSRKSPMPLMACEHPHAVFPSLQVRAQDY